MNLFENILCITLLTSFSCALQAMEKKRPFEEQEFLNWLADDDLLKQMDEKSVTDEFLQQYYDAISPSGDQHPGKFQKTEARNNTVDIFKETINGFDNGATTNALPPEPSYADLQAQLTQTRDQVTQLNAIVASHAAKIEQLERIVIRLHTSGPLQSVPASLPKLPPHLACMQMPPKPAPQAKKIIIQGPPSLLQAAFDGNLDLTRKLLQTGANVNEKNTDRIAATPLYYAIVKKKPNLEVIKLLIKNGAAINAQTTAGITPLMAAIKIGNIEIVKILLNEKPDLTIAYVNNGKKFTALDVARIYASNMHPEIYAPIVKLLEQFMVGEKK